MSIRGTLKENVWDRRPELIPVMMREHKTHKGLFFEIGYDPATGQYEVRRVIYPRAWAKDRIQAAVQNRERIFETEGCPHCKILNTSTNTNTSMSTSTRNSESIVKERRLRLLPGKRLIRDRVLRFWDNVPDPR